MSVRPYGLEDQSNFLGGGLRYYHLGALREEHHVPDQQPINRQPSEVAWSNGPETVLDVRGPPPVGFVFYVLADVRDEALLASTSFLAAVNCTVDVHHRQHVPDHEALCSPHRP